MIWLYLVVFLAGLVITSVAKRRRTKAVWLSALGTIVAALGVLGAASMGMYLAALATVLLLISLAQIGRSRATA